MSENLLRILLTELGTVRVACKKCNRGIIEVSVDRLDAALNQGECRFCGHRFHGSGPDPLNNLKIALSDLKRMQDIEVSFVIPEPTSE